MGFFGDILIAQAKETLSKKQSSISSSVNTKLGRWDETHEYYNYTEEGLQDIGEDRYENTDYDDVR